jgi:hypothetical protein
MALVQLMPLRNRPNRPAQAVTAEYPEYRRGYGAPSPKPAPPKNIAKVEVGPIVIEQRESGDLVIYTQQTLPVTSRVGECDVMIKRMTASETNRILIKNEDVQDLLVALDGVLGNRPSKLTK